MFWFVSFSEHWQSSLFWIWVQNVTCLQQQSSPDKDNWCWCMQLLFNLLLFFLHITNWSISFFTPVYLHMFEHQPVATIWCDEHQIIHKQNYQQQKYENLSSLLRADEPRYYILSVFHLCVLYRPITGSLQFMHTAEISTDFSTCMKLNMCLSVRNKEYWNAIPCLSVRNKEYWNAILFGYLELFKNSYFSSKYL